MSTTKEQKLITFATRLRTRRDRLGLTQTELAEKSQISARSITAWERGLNLPNTSLLDRLADSLGVSAGWLLGFDDTPPSTVDRRDAAPEQNTDRGIDPSRHQFSTETTVRQYVEELLKRAKGRTDRIGWLMMELRRKIPLTCFDDLDD